MRISLPKRLPRLERHRACVVLLGLGILTVCGPSIAATWRSVTEVDEVATVTVAVAGEEFTYYVLDPERATRFELRGPRRLKIVSRYLFDAADPDEQTYAIWVLVDGAEVLRKTFHGHVISEVTLPGETETAVAALRRCYVRIGTGVHTVQVLTSTPGQGRVATRFFRESRHRPAATVAYAPEGFDTIYHLQFASGSQSTYYHFGSEEPLTFTVNGPTTLKIYTRLDFQHTMNGSQAYSLEVICDGEVWQSFHYHTEKLSMAQYVERQDILPGARKLMRVPVPKGSHRYTVRCIRPSDCGIAAQIRIPQADISSRPQ